jgi:hypothetical protein
MGKLPDQGDGRILALLGHYHSHGKHFTASIRHAGGEVQKVFETYDYLDPAMFEFDSVSKNPTLSDKAAGAVSGMLESRTATRCSGTATSSTMATSASPTSTR